MQLYINIVLTSNYMHQENNPYLRKLDDARKKWSESEWLLNILRSDTGLVKEQPTDEQLLQWAQKLNNQQLQY